MDFDTLALDIANVLKAELGISARHLRFFRQSGNTVFIDDGQRLVVRVPLVGACPRLPTDEHLEAIQRSAAAGIPVAPPLVPRVLWTSCRESRFTVWPLLIPASGVSGADVAGVVSELHSHETEHGLPAFDLEDLRPDFDRLTAAAAQLGIAAEVAGESQARTEASWVRLRERRPTGPSVPIHCDPYPDNLALAADGRLVLIDLDELSVGPRELDLEKLIKLARRFGACFPAASNEGEMLDAYQHDYSDEMLEDLHLLGDFESAMGAVNSWECVPSEFNRIRAEQRIRTLADPHAPWLTF